MCANILYEEGQYEDALKVIQASNSSELDKNDDSLEAIKARYQNAQNEGCIYF